MCGICGMIPGSLEAPVEKSILERMNRVLKHRGPDEEGYFISRGAGLGHQRLSIIDLKGGTQPMQDPSKRYTLVFNGEIYNFQSLRAELAQQGVSFQTSSDTEVLLQLFARKGPACLQELTGMFAFAVWDAEKKELFAARDRIGKKPFFYSEWGGDFYFASEIKALLQVPGFPRELERGALENFLAYTYIPYPQTAFRHVLELPPAHSLTYRSGHVRIEKYWRPSFLDKKQVTARQAVGELKDLLKEAVRVRMTSDVPVGAFLSGGVDSSIVTALMTACTQKPVRTFTVGFKEERFNEIPYARRVAHYFETQHHEKIVQPRVAQMFPRLVWHYDQPFSDVSALPSFYVAQMASEQGIKVVLNGDGGDENFCGYDRFSNLQKWKKFRHLPGFLRNLLGGLGFLVQEPKNPGSFLNRAGRYLEDMGGPGIERGYLRHMIQLRPRDRQEFLKTEKLHPGPENFIHQLYQQGEFQEPLDGYLLVELLSYLPCDLLVKMDRASMAYGVETRSPFLDHRVIEYAASLPFRLKIQGGQSKFLLKQMIQQLMPDPMWGRPKTGFGVPIGQWLRTDLRILGEQVLLDPQTLARPFWNGKVIERMWKQHQNQEAEHGHRLWSLLVFEWWHRNFIDQIPLGPLE